MHWPSSQGGLTGSVPEHADDNNLGDGNTGVRPELPSTARDVLEAAKRLVLRRGLPGLTLDAVAEESGQYRSAIRYHFGDKAGLVSAVLDSTALTPTTSNLFAAPSGLPAGPERIEAHMKALREVSVNREQFRIFWSLLPQMLRDPDLGNRLSALYKDYRHINRDALGARACTPEHERRVLGLVWLVTAVCDGLGLMACLCEDSEPVSERAEESCGSGIDAAYEVLGELLQDYLPTLSTAQGFNKQPKGP